MGTPLISKAEKRMRSLRVGKASAAQLLTISKGGFIKSGYFAFAIVIYV